MPRLKWSAFFVVALTISGLTLSASSDSNQFQQFLLKASQISCLTSPDSVPFHLKLSASETHPMDPKNNKAEIEIWWAAPDKWRREIKSPPFSQTAVRNGTHYYESNTADYLPFWIHELIQESTDPVPIEQLKNEPVELNRANCGEWESNYTAESDQIGVHHSVCFNADGTLGKVFAPTVSADLGKYESFGKKRVPRAIKVWPGNRAEVLGVVTQLENLTLDDSLFVITNETGFDSRLRFVSVPESALDSYKLSTPPPSWPILHNFPATGALTINVKLDREGNVREVGSPISRNVVVNDAAAAQIKTWKFKPYPDETHPVEVDTYLTLSFDSKVLLLGGDGKTYATENFFQRIARARQLSDPSVPGSTPFHLHASFLTADNSSGTYEEFWLSPTRWWRQVQLGTVRVVKTQLDNKLFTKNSGSPFTPKLIDFFLDSLDLPFPRTDGSFIEGDWGHSAVQFEGVDMVRVARGQVDERNRPITGQAYWFDSNDLLHAAYWDPKMTSYRHFQPWNDKMIPRRIELAQKDALLMVTTIDLLEPPPQPLADSFFLLDGVEAQLITDPDDYEGPVMVQPKPIYQVKPDNPHSGHGTVLVNVQLDQHGHVVNATIRQSAGQPLDEAALRAASQWEFSPMQIRGKPVPTATVLRFDF
jgi:TonB family protein